MRKFGGDSRLGKMGCAVIRLFIKPALWGMAWQCLFIAACSQPNKGDSPNAPAGVAGVLRTHVLESRIFGNERTLRVLLPPGYTLAENGSSTYPVLYLNDGQNLFDAAQATFNPMEWKVDESTQQLIRDREIPPIIVVGIDHAGRRERPREYLPYPDAYLDPPVADPEGYRYPEFLTEEVMPFIESRYRIKRGAGQTGLGGSSYGALIALYTVIKKPGVFGRLLLESPSLYVSDRRVLQESQSVTRWPERVYVGVGTHEGLPDCSDEKGNPEAVDDVRSLEGILREAGLGDDRMRIFVERCGLHDEAAWARRFPAALRFLYHE